jgi:hypothetical protein
MQVFSLTHELRWYQSIENQMRHGSKGYTMGPFEGQQPGHGPHRRYGGPPAMKGGQLGDVGARRNGPSPSGDGKRTSRSNRT